MKSPIRLVKYFITISALVIAIQVVSMPFANAVDNITPQGTSGDLSIFVESGANERMFGATVCNNGTDDISAFTLNVQFTNYSLTLAQALPGGFASSNVLDSGSFDQNSSVWTGTLKGSDSRALLPPTLDLPDPVNTPQCVSVGYLGKVTGNLGETIVVTASITSSTLGDSTPNVDPDNSNDSFTYTTQPITPDPNLVLETRLLTTGTITNGTPVAYELTIKNIGAGTYTLSGQNPIGIYFIVPSGATYSGVTDIDPGDHLNIDPGDCGFVANVNGYLPAFTGYDADLAGCQFTTTTGTIEPGESFKLQFNMIANGPFSDGSTKVMAILSGNDVDSLLLQVDVFNPATNPLNIVNDNFVLLGFDSTPLTATVNRCSGVGEVIKTNDACFTITFNKPIVEEDFTIDDIKVSGSGTIYSFQKTGTNEWTIRINGMKSGDVISITLEDKRVQDYYSAIQNGTQVLGINTVRYEAEAGSAAATGTLANTGAKNSEKLFQISLILMIFGLAIKIASKKREIATT